MAEIVDIIRIRQEANVFNDIGINGHPMLEAERDDGDSHTLFAVCNSIALHQDFLQLFRLQIRRIDNKVGLSPQRSQAFSFFGNPLADAAVRGQRVNAARFFIAADQSLIRSFNKDDFIRNSFFFQILQILQALTHGIKKFTAANIGNEGNMAHPFTAFDA